MWLESCYQGCYGGGGSTYRAYPFSPRWTRRCSSWAVSEEAGEGVGRTSTNSGMSLNSSDMAQAKWTEAWMEECESEEAVDASKVEWNRMSCIPTASCSFLSATSIFAHCALRIVMSVIRPFDPTDILRFNKVNQDPWTATVRLRLTPRAGADDCSITMGITVLMPPSGLTFAIPPSLLVTVR